VHSNISRTFDTENFLSFAILKVLTQIAFTENPQSRIERKIGSEWEFEFFGRHIFFLARTRFRQSVTQKLQTKIIFDENISLRRFRDCAKQKYSQKKLDGKIFTIYGIIYKDDLEENPVFWFK